MKGRKFEIVSLSEIGDVDFYGAEVGDIVQIENHLSGNVWCIGSDVFKEEGWTGLSSYCVADTMSIFLQYVKEVV